MERNEKDKVTIPIICRNCGKKVFIKVFPEDLTKYEEGALVQDAFPYLEPEKREMLISGICPECWNNEFVELEDE